MSAEIVEPTSHPEGSFALSSSSQEQEQQHHPYPQELHHVHHVHHDNVQVPVAVPSPMKIHEDQVAALEASGLQEASVDDHHEHDYSLKRPLSQLEEVQVIHEFPYPEEPHPPLPPQEQVEEEHDPKRPKTNHTNMMNSQEEDLFLMDVTHTPGANNSNNTNNNLEHNHNNFVPVSMAAAAKKVNNEQWEAMFARLIHYKGLHGDCLVPKRYANDPKLGTWVETQVRLIHVKQE